MSMFCYQCEQAAKGTGCNIMGVCGKDPETTKLQDLLIYALKGIAVYGKLARELGIVNDEIDRFVIEGLFTTVTNVNFDPETLQDNIIEAFQMKERARGLFEKGYQKKHGKLYPGKLPVEAEWKPADTQAGLIEQAERVGVLADVIYGEDIKSLRGLLLYGMKGMAAYADHAWVLGKRDEAVTSFFFKGLSALANDRLTADELTGLVLECGKVNLRCMEILDQAHTERYGHPEPTPVSIGIKKGPAIVVSGHDLLDLEMLLQQTEGKGINIYTHGEMLPAHGYPALKKYKHLVGNYGGAWQDQANEFDAFPGAILMTTNCIQKPRDTYQDRIFTTGLVEWPGVRHIPEQGGKKDFTLVIQKALQAGGFPADVPDKTILVGCGHQAVLNLAGQVVDAVKQGKVRHFFLVGGCDGAKPGRNYYTDFAMRVPEDCVILTLACGKFRFNKLDFGDIGGIPRLLDVGQCNDAYSAVKIALALAEAFKCGVNELPLSLVLSWYEQKAVVILLTLLSLAVTSGVFKPQCFEFARGKIRFKTSDDG